MKSLSRGIFALVLFSGVLVAGDESKVAGTCNDEKTKIQWLEAKITNLEQRLNAMAAMYDTTVKGFQIEANKPKDKVESATIGNASETIHDLPSKVK